MGEREGNSRAVVALGENSKCHCVEKRPPGTLFTIRKPSSYIGRITATEPRALEGGLLCFMLVQSTLCTPPS